MNKHENNQRKLKEIALMNAGWQMSIDPDYWVHPKFIPETELKAPDIVKYQLHRDDAYKRMNE